MLNVLNMLLSLQESCKLTNTSVILKFTVKTNFNTYFHVSQINFLLQESDQQHYRQALECLRTEIRASTTSMTSVPKPLKFLRPHYGTLKKAYEKISDDETKVS